MKKLSLAIAFLMCVAQSYACDVCGGSTGGSYPVGIMPMYNSHFVGISYRTQSFRSTHPIVNGESANATSHDRFRSLTIWGRFYPLKRVQVLAALPYQINDVTENGQTTKMHGLGDAQLTVNYMLLNKADSTGTTQHILLAGGGVKAPTGKYGYRNSEGIILSNMQPGTASWDFVANAAYMARFNRTGFNIDATYRYNTTNAHDYRFGDKVNAGATAFYRLEKNKWSILPLAGVRYEYSAQDISSNTYKIFNSYSGGQQLYGNAGVNLYYGQAGISALFGLPLWEDYAQNLVKGNLRSEIQIQYLF